MNDCDDDEFRSLLSSRENFNKFVYTPLSEAIRLLQERRNNPELMEKIKKLFKGEIPELLINNNCGVLARQIATPNHESRVFISTVKESGLVPVFFEYTDDKFSSKNKYKHSLGKIKIKKYLNKKGEDCVEKINIIDFNQYDGKKLKNVKTLWGESLFDFHKKLFQIYNLKDLYFHDESDWYKINKIKNVKEAYQNFFLLFICFGVLFENFLISKDDEGEFTKKIVLPCIKKITNLTGLKPLIVPIEMIELEINDFWYYHLPIVKSNIKK